MQYPRGSRLDAEIIQIIIMVAEHFISFYGTKIAQEQFSKKIRISLIFFFLPSLMTMI
jgi:hypothetical protein